VAYGLQMDAVKVLLLEYVPEKAKSRDKTKTRLQLYDKSYKHLTLDALVEAKTNVHLIESTTAYVYERASNRVHGSFNEGHISSLLSSRLWCNRVILLLLSATPKSITEPLFTSVAQPSVLHFHCNQTKCRKWY
jgi:hypothetical protein